MQNVGPIRMTAEIKKKSAVQLVEEIMSGGRTKFDFIDFGMNRYSGYILGTRLSQKRN